MIECHSHVTCILSSFNSSSAIVIFFSPTIFTRINGTLTSFNNFSGVLLPSDTSSIKMCKTFIRLILRSSLVLVSQLPKLLLHKYRLSLPYISMSDKERNFTTFNLSSHFSVHHSDICPHLVRALGVMGIISVGDLSKSTLLSPKF